MSPAALSPLLKYRLLLELSQKISRTLDLEEVLHDLIRTLGTAMGYDAAGVFVLARSVPLPGSFTSRVISGVAQVGYDDPRADDPMFLEGKGIIGHVVSTGEMVLAPDVRRDPLYVVGRRATLSELAVPIVSSRGVIGALNVESDRLDAFSLADAELLEFFASAAALSIEKALLHREVLEKQRIEAQLAIAHDVQTGLLPAGPPAFPGYDIAAVNLPAWEIGGDYYDYLLLEPGQLGLVIADVSGKGIPAALIMATFRAAIRSEMRRRRPIGALAEQLNRILIESSDAPRFVTAVSGFLDAASGRFSYVNCGHNPPLLLRRGGGTEVLSPGGPVLGVVEAGRFVAGDVSLAPGDVLALYTDGVVEPSDRDDGEFGAERLERTVRSAMASPAREILERVIEATSAFSGRERYEDDFTLVVVKRHRAT